MKYLEEGSDVILEIEMQGARQVKEMYPEAVLIFVLPPSLEELRNRLTTRGTETLKSKSTKDLVLLLKR